MGITNPDNQHEVSQCAANQKDYGIQLQDTGVEDTAGPDKRADIDRFSDFMRGLAPPPTLPQNEAAQTGASLFTSMGSAANASGRSTNALSTR